MIHLVTRANRHLYERQLQQFFALDDNRVDGDDDDQAVYLVGLDADGDFGIGVRLRPTLQGSVVGDRFPHLVEPDQALFYGGGALEASRLVVGCFPSHEGSRAHAELRLAMLEAAQLLGASRIVGTTQLARWPMLDGCGWRISLLGVPMPSRNGTKVAFSVGASADDVHAMRDAWAIERALIYLDDHIAEGLAVEQVGRHADEWGRLTDEERRMRIVGQQLAEATPGWSSSASRDADRSALEEALQILDTVINQGMLQRPDNDLRQQGAIMLLSVAQSRLRAHLEHADLGPSVAYETNAPALRSTH